MNIFWLHEEPKINARYHCDRHVIKMILEYAQMLSTTNRLCGLDEGYKIAHMNHPCTKWVRESYDNWLCLKWLAFYLNEEYKYRYGKTHKSWEVIASLHKPNLPNLGVTIPPQCMPSEYKHKNVFIAYRNYYIGDKASFATWKFRTVPPWFNFNKVLIK